MCVAGSQPMSEKFSLQNYIRVKNFRMFSVYKNIFTTKKKKEITVAYMYIIL